MPLTSVHVGRSASHDRYIVNGANLFGAAVVATLGVLSLLLGLAASPESDDSKLAMCGIGVGCIVSSVGIVQGSIVVVSKAGLAFRRYLARPRLIEFQDIVDVRVVPAPWVMVRAHGLVLKLSSGEEYVAKLLTKVGSTSKATAAILGQRLQSIAENPARVTSLDRVTIL